MHAGKWVCVFVIFDLSISVFVTASDWPERFSLVFSCSTRILQKNRRSSSLKTRDSQSYKSTTGESVQWFSVSVAAHQGFLSQVYTRLFSLMHLKVKDSGTPPSPPHQHLSLKPVSSCRPPIPSPPRAGLTVRRSDRPRLCSRLSS